MPVIAGFNLFSSVLIFLLGYVNIISVMFFIMEMKSFIHKFADGFKVKHLFYILLLPGFLLSLLFVGMYQCYKLQLWRDFIQLIESTIHWREVLDFKIYPRPEWVSFILRVIITLLVITILFGLR
jgi:hypothetical protein